MFLHDDPVEQTCCQYSWCKQSQALPDVLISDHVLIDVLTAGFRLLRMAAQRTLNVCCQAAQAGPKSSPVRLLLLRMAP